jgi:hypothetical protein
MQNSYNVNTFDVSAFQPHQPTQTQPKTTRTVCNQPQANLLKNNSKAKITKNTNPTNSLHI